MPKSTHEDLLTVLQKTSVPQFEKRQFCLYLSASKNAIFVVFMKNSCFDAMKRLFHHLGSESRHFREK